MTVAYTDELFQPHQSARPLLEAYYRPHHQKLKCVVADALQENDVKGTFTLKLSNMLGTQAKAAETGLCRRI